MGRVRPRMLKAVVQHFYWLTPIRGGYWDPGDSIRLRVRPVLLRRNDRCSSAANRASSPGSLSPSPIADGLNAPHRFPASKLPHLCAHVDAVDGFCWVRAANAQVRSAMFAQRDQLLGPPRDAGTRAPSRPTRSAAACSGNDADQRWSVGPVGAVATRGDGPRCRRPTPSSNRCVVGGVTRRAQHRAPPPSSSSPPVSIELAAGGGPDELWSCQFRRTLADAHRVFPPTDRVASRRRVGEKIRWCATYLRRSRP